MNTTKVTLPPYKLRLVCINFMLKENGHRTISSFERTIIVKIITFVKEDLQLKPQDSLESDSKQSKVLRSIVISFLVKTTALTSGMITLILGIKPNHISSTKAHYLPKLEENTPEQMQYMKIVKKIIGSGILESNPKTYFTNLLVKNLVMINAA